MAKVKNQKALQEMEENLKKVEDSFAKYFEALEAHGYGSDETLKYSKEYGEAMCDALESASKTGDTKEVDRAVFKAREIMAKAGMTYDDIDWETIGFFKAAEEKKRIMEAVTFDDPIQTDGSEIPVTGNPLEDQLADAHDAAQYSSQLMEETIEDFMAMDDSLQALENALKAMNEMSDEEKQAFAMVIQTAVVESKIREGKVVPLSSEEIARISSENVEAFNKAQAVLASHNAQHPVRYAAGQVKEAFMQAAASLAAMGCIRENMQKNVDVAKAAGLDYQSAYQKALESLKTAGKGAAVMAGNAFDASKAAISRKYVTLATSASNIYATAVQNLHEGWMKAKESMGKALHTATKAVDMGLEAITLGGWSRFCTKMEERAEKNIELGHYNFNWSLEKQKSRGFEGGRELFGANLDDNKLTAFVEKMKNLFASKFTRAHSKMAGIPENAMADYWNSVKEPVWGAGTGERTAASGVVGKYGATSPMDVLCEKMDEMNKHLAEAYIAANEGFQESLQDIKDTVKENAKEIKDNFKEANDKAVENTKAIANKAANKAKEAGEKAVEGAKDLGDKAVQTGKAAGAAVVGAAVVAKGKVEDGAKYVSKKVLDAAEYAKQIAKATAEAAKETAGKVVAGAKKAKDAVAGAAREVAAQSVEAVGKFKSWCYSKDEALYGKIASYISQRERLTASAMAVLQKDIENAEKNIEKLSDDIASITSKKFDKQYQLGETLQEMKNTLIAQAAKGNDSVEVTQALSVIAKAEAAGQRSADRANGVEKIIHIMRNAGVIITDEAQVISARAAETRASKKMASMEAKLANLGDKSERFATKAEQAKEASKEVGINFHDMAEKIRAGRPDPRDGGKVEEDEGHEMV